MAVSELGYSINTTEVDKAAKSIDGLDAAEKRAAKSAAGMQGALGEVARESVGAAGALSDYDKSLGRIIDSSGRLREANGRFVSGVKIAEERAEGLRDKLDGVDVSQKNTAKSAGALQKAFLRLAATAGGALAAALSIRSLARASDTYTELTNILRVTAGEQADVNKELRELNEIASRTRAPLSSIAQLYQRVGIASRDLGADSVKTKRFVENVGLALAQQGGSAQQASGALLQLSQAMGSGTVRAEEFNSIVEGAYPIALSAAKGIDAAGGSVSKLRQLMIDGKVSSKEFFDAILSQTDDLEKTFASTNATIGQGLQSISDAFILLVGGMNNATGASSAVANALIFIGDNLSRIITYAATAATGFGVYYAGAMVIAAAKTATLSGALIFLRGALIRTGFGAIIVLVGELVYQMVRAVEATGSIGGAFELLAARGKVAWNNLKADFLYALADMTAAAAQFLSNFSKAMNSTFGTSFGESGLFDVAASFNSMGSDALVASSAAQAALAGIESGIKSVSESGGPDGAINSALFGPDDSVGSAGGKKRGNSALDSLTEDFKLLKEGLMTEVESLNAWFVESESLLNVARQAGLIESEREFLDLKLRMNEEYQERLASINGYYSSDALTQASTFFGDMAANMQSGNEKMLKIAKIFSASQALINSYVAYTEVLRDPLLPWFARIPAAVGVLSAGMGMVSAIKGAGKGSGSGSKAGASAATSQAPSAPQRQINLTVQGEYFTGDTIQRIAEGLNDFIADGGNINVVRA